MTNNDSPLTRQIHLIKCQTKLKYEHALKQAFVNFENKHDDEIYLHFLNKDIPEFWKSWKSKFKRKVVNNVQINGLSDDTDISNCFADHFASI